MSPTNKSNTRKSAPSAGVSKQYPRATKARKSSQKAAPEPPQKAAPEPPQKAAPEPPQAEAPEPPQAPVLTPAQVLEMHAQLNALNQQLQKQKDVNNQNQAEKDKLLAQVEADREEINNLNKAKVDAESKIEVFLSEGPVTGGKKKQMTDEQRQHKSNLDKIRRDEIKQAVHDNDLMRTFITYCLKHKAFGKLHADLILQLWKLACKDASTTIKLVDKVQTAVAAVQEENPEWVMPKSVQGKYNAMQNYSAQIVESMVKFIGSMADLQKKICEFATTKDISDELSTDDFFTPMGTITLMDLYVRNSMGKRPGAELLVNKVCPNMRVSSDFEYPAIPVPDLDEGEEEAMGGEGSSSSSSAPLGKEKKAETEAMDVDEDEEKGPSAAPRSSTPETPGVPKTPEFKEDDDDDEDDE